MNQLTCHVTEGHNVLNTNQSWIECESDAFSQFSLILNTHFTHFNLHIVHIGNFLFILLYWVGCVLSHALVIIIRCSVPVKGKRDFKFISPILPSSLPMASISSFYYKNPQEVFDFIDDQFTLKPDSLVELTKTFLDEVKTGLTNYNQAMAMMCAFILFTKTLSLTCFQSLICYRCSQWFRNWVCCKHQSKYYFLIIHSSTFLALDLGGTNLWFEVSYS